MRTHRLKSVLRSLSVAFFEQILFVFGRFAAFVRNDALRRRRPGQFARASPRFSPCGEFRWFTFTLAHKQVTGRVSAYDFNRGAQ
jgi:hypothetical protein